MSDTLTKNELRSINRQLAELRAFMEVNDIVNRKQALEILNIEASTLSSYISEGKIIVVSRNKAGQAFFSRTQLMGLK